MTNVVDNTTLLIHLESNAYPLRLADLPKRHPNVSFGPTVPSSFITGLGYAMVSEVIAPVANVVTELAPVVIDGAHHQAFEGRDFTAEEIKLKLDNKKQNLINTYKGKLRTCLATGFEFKHGENTHNLQLREVDYSKLLMVLKLAELKVEANSDKMTLLRVASNQVIVMSPIEVIEVIEGALAKFEALNNTFYKVEADALAASSAELAAIKDPFNMK